MQTARDVVFNFVSWFGQRATAARGQQYVSEVDADGSIEAIETAAAEVVEHGPSFFEPGVRDAIMDGLDQLDRQKKPNLWQRITRRFVDTDGDHFNDENEVRAGSSRLDPESTPRSK